MIAHGVPVAAAVAIAMGGALLVGMINAVVVVVMEPSTRSSPPSPPAR